MSGSGVTLRLVWPQWQGAGADMVAELVPELPLDDARLGYAVGARVLEAVLPGHDGPTEVVPVPMSLPTSATVDGVESRAEVLQSLAAAQAVLGRSVFDRVLTLGGECSVSVAPFAALADRYGDDLAVLWVDSHPDVGTPASRYSGYHAMAVAVLTGHGDREVVEALPATIDPSRVALVGLHEWTGDDYPHIAEWGLTAFAPDQLRTDSRPLLDWLAGTGCSRVAIHFDLDTIDNPGQPIALGTVTGGLTGFEARRVMTDVAAVAEVVGFTVAEFVPRDVLRVQRLVRGMPLIPDH